MGERPVPRPGVDPLLTEDDLDEVLDYFEHEESLCPGGCGHPKIETLDPANEWAYDGVVVACAACAARRRAEKTLDDLDGVMSYAVKKKGR